MAATSTSVVGTGLTPEQLARNSVHRRAVEAVIWGMPAVNAELLYQAMVQAKGDFNQIVYWSRLADWKNQTLTPNPDTIYVFPFFNTKDVGPMVLEIPPAGEGADGGSITGSVDDAWQTALEDVGPAGVDKGKGGKYLILPPGFKGKAPDDCIPLASLTSVASSPVRRRRTSSFGSSTLWSFAKFFGSWFRSHKIFGAVKPVSAGLATS